MKTLYININNESIQSNDKLKILNYDLDSDFFFYLGSKIARGCNVENVIALVTDFKNEDKEEYKKIIAQWNDLKAVLFSEDCKGHFEFTLPNGYIHWLEFHSQYVDIYHKNFSYGESAVISVDLEELYDESVEELQSQILRKLQRDNLYQEIDEIVFNDDAVTLKSPAVRSIKEKYEGIGFKIYKKWLQENEEKLQTPPQICERCKKNPCECNTNPMLPVYGVVLGQTKNLSNLKFIIEKEDTITKYIPIKDSNIWFGKISGSSSVNTMFVSSKSAQYENILSKIENTFQSYRPIKNVTNMMVYTSNLPLKILKYGSQFIIVEYSSNNNYMVIDECLDDVKESLKEYILKYPDCQATIK